MIKKSKPDRRSDRRRLPWTLLFLLVSLAILTGSDQPRLEAVKIATRSLLPQASVGKDYSFQFQSAGKGQALEWRLLAPVRPNDWEEWKLELTGRLSGKATGAACDAAACPEGWICGSGKRCEGIVTFYVSASNSKGQFDQRLFDLVVTDPANPLEVGNFPTLMAGATGQPYLAPLYARGGLAPFSWKKSEDTLPPGLSLGADGVLSGTPTTPGTFTWTVEVTDSKSKKASKRLNLRIDDVSQPIVFTPNPKAIVRSLIPRVGVNVGDELNHWDDRKLSIE